MYPSLCMVIGTHIYFLESEIILLELECSIHAFARFHHGFFWSEENVVLNPFLPSQFSIKAGFSISGISYDIKTLHTSSLKFFSSLYISSVSQTNVGCFIIGPYFGSHALSCTDLLTCHLYFSVSLLLYTCFWVCLCDTTLFYYLAFLRLPFLSLLNGYCLHLPIWDFFTPDTM